VVYLIVRVVGRKNAKLSRVIKRVDGKKIKEGVSMSIIKSILDNDQYKFSMCAAILKLFPQISVRYHLIVRESIEFPEGFADRLRKEVNYFSTLSLAVDEHQYLRTTCSYLGELFLSYLKTYRYDPKQVIIDQCGHKLAVRIEGLWSQTIFWEVPLMALISAMYFKMTGSHILDHGLRNQEKAQQIIQHGLIVADFGSRRRYSNLNHRYVITDMGSSLVGTSNVYFAKLFNIKPIGTQAHEWVMFHGARYGYEEANVIALENWRKVFGDELGVALTDTYTSDHFFNTVPMHLANAFGAIRQDSGDPLKFVDKAVKFYEKHGVDPTTKTIVFSDNLTINKAVAIHDYCAGKIQDSYGIGTHLTNDVDVKPLNIVIKMSQCKINDYWRPVIKLSDDKGKHTGKETEIANCIQRINA